MESFCVSHLEESEMEMMIAGTRNYLHMTAEEEEIVAVEQFLSQRVSVNAVDKLERTTLHVAASKGDKTTVKLLLEEGADINEKDNQGRSPLHFAAENGFLDIVEMILKTPPINGKSVDVNCRTLRQETPLHFAALNGHVKIVEQLIQRGAVDFQENQFGTALHVASAAGHADVVKMLINLGSDVNFCTMRDIGIGWRQHTISLTPLHCAVFGTRYFGEDFQHLPSENLNEHQVLEQEEIIDALLGAGARYNVVLECETALQFVLYYGHPLSLKKFLHYGAYVDEFSNEGKTVLHYAARVGSPTFIRILLDFGANVNQKDKSGRTPLHIAAFWNREEVVSMLLLAGAVAHSESTDTGSVIYYHCLGRYGKKSNASIIYRLLEYGADFNHPCNLGDSGTHVLCEGICNEEYAIFLDRFLDFNIKNNDVNQRRPGCTPFGYAFYGSQAAPDESIEFIIKAMALMESSFNSKISDFNEKIMVEQNRQDFYQRCKSELEDLKQKKVYGQITYYDLLIKPIKKLTQFCRNVRLIEILDSGACVKFVMYGSLIEKRMKFAYERTILLEKSLPKLNHLVDPWKLPRYVGLDILSHLTSCELDDFCKAECES